MGNGTDAHAYFGDPEVGLRRPQRPSRGRRSWCFRLVLFVAFVSLCGYAAVSYHEQKAMKAQIQEHETALHDLEVDLSAQFDAKVQKLAEEKSRLQAKLSDETEVNTRNRQLKDENSQLQTQVAERASQYDDTTKTVEELQKRVRDFEANDKSKKVVELQNRVRNFEASNGRLAEQKNDLETSKEMLTAEKNTLAEQETKLQQAIQLMSKTALLEKFGPGPHRLEMTVNFDSHKGREDGGVITLEMAPVAALPHAVYWFLEQVSRGLYDGYSIHRNVGHVLLVGPIKNFLSTKNFDRPKTEKRFRDAGFDKVLFQEYSDTFPHVKYTLGYAGRPGGPSFYFNIKNNTAAHGPGGQGDNHADVCFAKVVDGVNVVDRITKLPAQEGKNKPLKEIVAIKSIRILPRKN